VLSAANKRKRLAFALASQSVEPKRLVFLDSKYLYVYEDPSKQWKYAWQREGEKITVPACSNPKVLHVYSAVGYGHKASIMFVAPTPSTSAGSSAGRINFASRHYVEVMKQLIPTIKQWFPAGAKWHLVQDHAKQHTSKASSEFLHSMNVSVLPGFPAQSWDMNVIEPCWGMLTTSLQGRRPSTLDGFKRIVRQAWDAIDQASIDKLVLSWGSRLQGCKTRKGAWPSA
jgi:hypothetical protein